MVARVLFLSPSSPRPSSKGRAIVIDHRRAVRSRRLSQMSVSVSALALVVQADGIALSRSTVAVVCLVGGSTSVLN